MPRALLSTCLLMLLALCAPARVGAELPDAQQHAKSAILMIGDGMGLIQIQAAREWSGRALALDAFPTVGLARTRSGNSGVTDSAAAATALACGVRTTNGAIGMTNPDTDPEGRSRPLQSITQVALAAGKSVGIISTAHVTHATPAGFYAHVPSRGDEVQIADQVSSSGLTLLLGGGRQFFYPQQTIDLESPATGARTDGRNVAGELAARGWSVINSLDEFQNLIPGQAGLRVLGLFEADHMRYDLDRPADKLGEPALAEMTRFAIDVLSRDPDGYFLMVEGGRIDHAGHENDIRNNIGDMLAFDGAIEVANERASAQTLIVVTADHETGGLTLPGELKAGMDASKVVKWSTNGHTAANVGVFARGPGAAAYEGAMENYEIPWKLADAMGVKFTDTVNLENKGR